MSTDVRGLTYSVVMHEKEPGNGDLAAKRKVRLVPDDELTPAAQEAMHRRSDEELRRLADRANRRG